MDAAAWMSLGNTGQSEGGRTRKDTRHRKIHRDRNRSVVARGWGGRE